MKCPYCAGDMEQGVLESTVPINFLKEARFINKPKEGQGEFILSYAFRSGYLFSVLSQRRRRLCVKDCRGRRFDLTEAAF